MPKQMTPRASGRSPDTILLVHGFWVTPRSWEHWIPHYQAKGYRVIAPAYPGFEVEVEALNSAPTEGVLVAPWSQIRASFPVLKSPANRHRAVGLTYEQWRYTFTNTFPEAEARALYGRYHVPASGGILWDSVLANLEPGPQATWVNYHNAARPPLLFIAGG